MAIVPSMAIAHLAHGGMNPGAVRWQYNLEEKVGFAMALHVRDKGPDVKALQNVLIRLGYQLPRWGADGDLGGETLDAVAQLLTDHGRTVDPDCNTVDDYELAFIHALHDTVKTEPPDGPAPPPMIDRRAFTGTRKDCGPRKWTEVTGWCLHQTACHLGASSKIDRCDGVGAHFVVYQNGDIFWLHDLNRTIIHGHGWNNRTIGIEIDGLFAGIEGDPSTVWDDPSTPFKEKVMSVTPAQIEAVKRLIRWGTAEVARHGGKVTKIVAHRQSSETRRHDPGSKVWQEIAIPLSQELGMDDGGVGFKIGHGRAIPVEWDLRCKGVKY